MDNLDRYEKDRRDLISRHRRDLEAIDKKINKEKELKKMQKDYEKRKKEQEQRQKEIEKKRKEQQRKQNNSNGANDGYQSFVKDSMTITEMNRLLDEWLSQL